MSRSLENLSSGFRPGPSQTRMYGCRIWLEAQNFRLRNKRDCTIYVAKRKARIRLSQISCSVTVQLICVFVLAYTKSRFSHDTAHILHVFLLTVDAGGQNKQHLASKNTAKLDRETEELHHEHVTLDTAKLIQQARQAKGWTQKDLATVSSLVTCKNKTNKFFKFVQTKYC